MSAPVVSPVPAFPVDKLLHGVRSSTSLSAERMTRGAGGDLAFLADDGTPVEMGFVLGWLDGDAEIEIEGVVICGDLWEDTVCLHGFAVWQIGRAPLYLERQGEGILERTLKDILLALFRQRYLPITALICQ